LAVIILFEQKPALRSSSHPPENCCVVRNGDRVSAPLQGTHGSTYRMIRKVICSLVLLIPTTIPAQQYEKNGLPCIPELCIGDGLPELGKIKWDRAKSDFSITGKPDYVGSQPLTATAVTLIKKDYRGDVTKATPYLSYQASDNNGLALLAKSQGPA
jgi:hypothetical protein